MHSLGKSGIAVSRRSLLSLRDAVLPPACLGCDRQLAEPGALCATCWDTMRFIEKPYCSVMGMPFSYDLGDGVLSAEAIANPPPFERVRSVVLYDMIARQLVQSLKFSDRTDLAPWMASWMMRASDGLLDPPALIVPVPLHRWRLWKRRFNQSAELARPLALSAEGKARGLEYRPDVLIRSRRTRQQVGLKAKERARNVQGAFRVPTEKKIDVQGRRVVLIDDVYTTGATLKACARALRRGGAREVACLTFARVATGDL
ncbi:MAG: ComF family protein [Pseudomonadota bacterium]